MKICINIEQKGRKVFNVVSCFVVYTFRIRRAVVQKCMSSCIMSLSADGLTSYDFQTCVIFVTEIFSYWNMQTIRVFTLF